MAVQDTDTGFIDYRYYRPKFHYSKKIAVKFEVNQNESSITFSCAICSEDDNFCRETAREITSRRMADLNIYLGEYDRSKPILDNIKDITEMLAEQDGSSRLIRQLNDAFAEVEIAKIIDESILVEF